MFSETDFGKIDRDFDYPKDFLPFVKEKIVVLQTIQWMPEDCGCLEALRSELDPFLRSDLQSWFAMSGS